MQTPKLTNVQLLDGGWLNKYMLTYELPDGSQYKYEAVSRKGLAEYKKFLERASAETTAKNAFKDSYADAVCIVPFLGDGSILLIREFRYAVNGWVIAFPAGLLEADEDIKDCVDRELREETGYKVRTDSSLPIRMLPQSGYSSVGMTDENVQVVIAQVERDVAQELQQGELIEIFTLAPSDIADFLVSNTDIIGTRCQLILSSIIGEFVEFIK